MAEAAKNTVEEQPEDNRSHRPSSQAFKDFMSTGWGPRPTQDVEVVGAVGFLPERSAALGKHFPNQQLVFPAGNLKTRNNDTDHRFRADSNFVYLTGLGEEMEPDAVVVLAPTDSGTHEATVFFTPRTPRGSEEFYADARYGEFWVGARPSLEEMTQATGLKAADIATLEEVLRKNAKKMDLRLISGLDPKIDALVEGVRKENGWATGNEATAQDTVLVERIAEQRLVKDAYEVTQIEEAIGVTKTAFEAVIAALPQALEHPQGERVLETAFAAVARQEGNGLGYETIAAGGNNANTLHWGDNNGPILPDSLVLIDAGIELDSLYTADITRTLPTTGRFTEAQARVYQAVLEANEAAIEAAGQPGATISTLHEAAQKVLAHHLADWGLLPVSVEESLSQNGQQHRRWMPHGTGHHLGLDVHDGAGARTDVYREGPLQPGMVFTIEPGLYFREDDLLVPEEMRGIGVRIEDNILIDADGKPQNLSSNIPKSIAGVEEWMRQVQKG